MCLNRLEWLWMNTKLKEIEEMCWKAICISQKHTPNLMIGRNNEIQETTKYKKQRNTRLQDYKKPRNTRLQETQDNRNYKITGSTS